MSQRQSALLPALRNTSRINVELEIKQTRRDDRGWRIQLLLNNEAVSGLSVCDRKMRIGSASVLTGGIAGV